MPFARSTSGKKITPPFRRALSFKLTYDTSWATTANGGNFATQTLLNAFNAVVDQFCQDMVALYQSSGTIGVNLNYVNLGATQGENSPTYDTLGYQPLIALLQSLPKDPIKNASYMAFPASDPVFAINNPLGWNPPATWRIGTGHYAALTNTIDTANFQFYISNQYTWDTNLDKTVCAAGQYKLYQLFLHDFTQGWYRSSDAVSPGSGAVGINQGPMDWNCYSATGVRDWLQDTGGTRYFSWDGGLTNLATMCTTANKDPGDWSAGTGLPFGFTGFSTGTAAIMPRVPNDYRMMAAVGMPLSPLGRQMAMI